jgi:hypothetical protein
VNRISISFQGVEDMDAKTIKGEIETLSREDKTTLLVEVMPALCRELLGDEGCRARMMEVFGIDCLEELQKRFEGAI